MHEDCSWHLKDVFRQWCRFILYPKLTLLTHSLRVDGKEFTTNVFMCSKRDNFHAIFIEMKCIISLLRQRATIAMRWLVFTRQQMLSFSSSFSMLPLLSTFTRENTSNQFDQLADRYILLEMHISLVHTGLNTLTKELLVWWPNKPINQNTH